jgi:hypothetical protein
MLKNEHPSLACPACHSHCHRLEFAGCCGFLSCPGRFAPGFELSGLPGEAAIRGMSVLFVMWNVPYLVALWHPQRYKFSLWQALIMQMIGVLGEGYIYLWLPAAYAVLRSSILRFMAFDMAGLFLLVVALLLSRK